jgi:protocatechuate 3,4-dioxygenase beta subunit
MTTDPDRNPTRREFLNASVLVPAAFVVLAASDAGAQAPRLPPTPACADDGPVTPAQTEGPYFKPSSPRRASLLEPDVRGTRIVVEGTVLGTDCRPVPRALLDVWQADAQGRYDNAGFRLRGHQFTDDAGRYRLETIVPGLYPGRTRHVHVKVQAPHQPVLTTQLYFPGESANQRDFIFNPDLVLQVREAEGRKLARFDFVLDLRPSGGRRSRL